jgi:hypothetical protein
VIVKLINTDGLAFIGPGSEWFWTAVSGIVLAVTFLAIYRQLRLQASSAAIETVNRMGNEWASERKTRYKIDALVALREATDPATVQSAAIGNLVDFWEDAGALVKAGHVERRLVYQSFNNVCRWWWAVLSPGVRGARNQTGDPSVGEHFEWLAKALAEMDKKAGVTVPLEAANPALTLERRIQSARHELRVAEELRAVIVRPMEPAPASDPPAQAHADRTPTSPLTDDA